MTGISTGWEKRHLRDLVHIKHGFAFRGEHIGTNGPHVLVTPGNFFEEGGFKRNGDKQKRYNGAVPNEYILRAGSLVVAMTEQAEGLLGSAAFVPDDEIYLHNQRIGLVTSENTDIGFLYYLFNTPAVRQQIRASSSGTKVRHTSPSRIGEATAWLPTLAVQRRIAGILSAYDDLIEVNQRRIAILEDMARRLFDEWFVRFRYPGHEAVPLADTELGMVPKDWTPRMLSWWSEEVRDTTSPQQVDPLVAYVGLEHLPRRSTTLIEAGKAQDVTSSKLKFEAGDILFGKIRPYFHKVALMPFSGVCSTDAICIRLTNPKHTALVLSLTSSDAFVAQAVATSNGTKMPRADWKVLQNYPLPEPPEPLLKAFERTVDPMVRTAANLAAQNNRLREGRDHLLPKLISGEISVSAAQETFAEAAE